MSGQSSASPEPPSPQQGMLLQTLARVERLSELLPALHQAGMAAVDGRSSIVFQFDPSREQLQATSGLGARLPLEPWPADRGLVPAALFRDDRPVFVPELGRALGGIADALGTSSAVVVPLAHVDARIGVLVVGCTHPPEEDRIVQLSGVGKAIALALHRNRAARDIDLQRELRTLLQEFSRAVSSSHLSAGLEMLCGGACRLFGAGRSTIWLHDRRARTLVAAASSDPQYRASAPEISTADALAPAAVALRRDGADISTSAPGIVTVTIPLKGRRRALGTLVLDEIRPEPGTELDLVERADEAGRQLSAAIENVLLLQDVLQSRRQLGDTFNSLADLVVVCNREGRVVDVNRAFSDRAGGTPAELVDRPLEEIVAPATGRLLAGALENARGSRPVPVHAEIEDTTLKGTFMVTVTPLASDGGELSGAVLVARDVTPHAKLEAERAELRNKLVQSEKLAALGQFVAGIAHELNNPLQGVLGHLELLRATGAFPKPLRRDMHRIYREAERAAKIVRNLLVFAGSRRLTRRPTSINAVLTRVLAFRAPGLKAGNIDVQRHIEEGLPRVKGDGLLLQQALLNIVLNAEQAIGLDGRIAIHARFVGEASKIVIEIHDSGPGIPPAVLSRIFEPFYTTKEVGKGTGLGLAIAYGIIQEHGGQISAANHPSGGALFTIQLPVQAG